jgi:hypothetical protein
MLVIMLNKVMCAGISHVKNTLVDLATKSVTDLLSIAEASQLKNLGRVWFME